MPFTIYADFESLLIPHSRCDPNPEKSSTTTIHTHEPCSFGYFIKCSFDDSLNKYVSYRGENSATHFIERITEDAKRLFVNHLSQNKVMDSLTSNELHEYDNTNICHICKEIIDSDEKVQDHCHMTGKYRGPAHKYCNIQFRVPKIITCFFHNLAFYDAHLFIKELGADKGEIEVIAKTKENYISFTKKIKIDDNRTVKLRFVDSFKFMASSIDALSSGLINENFNQMKAQMRNYELLIRKGVFPYDYMDSWNKFSETQLPPREAFFNKLTNKSISEEDYNYAHKVWEKFQINDLGEYSDLYLKTDVILLTDIFENFRTECLKTYFLDPAHYFTAPGLSWDAMLFHTKIELELLTDIDMIAFLKRGIRGGISQCSQRYSEANNEHMVDFNKDKKKSYCIYLDANNLYGLAMSQPLPYGGFRWVEIEDIDDLRNRIESVEDDAEIGYILEVDLLYPKELHDQHNDLPFCPVNECPPNSKCPKLIASLKNKVKYVIDYRSLKQCLKAGLKLSKIHRALQFQQKAWLKSYIDLNNRLRTLAETEFLKMHYKYMNNSVFGKTMENVDKRCNVKIVTRWERSYNSPGASDLIAKPNFHSAAVLTNEMVIIQLNKIRIYYNKPIYIGFIVLELSKVHMYDFHYNHMLKKYHQSKITLNYMDTDSFIYHIKTDDLYKDMKEDIIDSKQIYDTSNYARDNIYGIPLVNKKVLGLMKDENGGVIMTKFVGLRSKMYSIALDDNSYIKKAKGIKKMALDQLNITDYENVLKNDLQMYSKMYVFRSKLHSLFTQLINKIGLSGKDDKRFILNDGSYGTLALGHYRIEEILLNNQNEQNDEN
jgi:Recombination endonuclease VII